MAMANDHGSKFLRARFRLRGILDASVFLVLVAAGSGTILGFLGAHGWIFDLFAHFRIQYAWALLAFGVWFVFRRKRLLSLAILALAVVNIGVVVPHYFRKPVQQYHETEPLRVMLINVNRSYGSPQSVLDAVRGANPDLVVLEEISDPWYATVGPALADGYPHHHTSLRSDNFGIGLWSKHPLVAASTLYSGDLSIPSIVADVGSPHGSVRVIATHPFPPISRDGARVRDEQLAELARRAAMADTPLLLVGDLNATRWSAAFGSLLRVSGLLDASLGRGHFPTWPAFLPVFLRIPIDHVLHTPDIEIVAMSTGSRVGSDHLPVVVDFRLPASGLVAMMVRSVARAETFP